MTQSTMSNFFSVQNPNNQFTSNFLKSQESKKENVPPSKKENTILDYFQTMSDCERRTETVDENTRIEVIEPKKTQTNILLNWLKKGERNFSRKWPFLPETEILRIMRFLSLEDNFRVGCVCKYWRKCFDSIWISYDFFGKFEINEKTAENKVKEVFERSSRLPHIQRLKRIFKGKNLSSVIKKVHFKTKMAKNGNSFDKVFERFEILPYRKCYTIFITDEQFTEICNCSKYSLQFINLTSCYMLTDRSLSYIASCHQLHTLIINNTSNLKEDCVAHILRSCKNIKFLSLSGCTSLSEWIIEIIATYGKEVQELDLGNNKKLITEKLSLLSSLKLTTLNLQNTNVNSQELESFLLKASMLQVLNLEGCSEIEGKIMNMIIAYCQATIKYLNISKIPKIYYSDVLNFVINWRSQIELQMDSQFFTEELQRLRSINNRLAI